MPAIMPREAVENLARRLRNLGAVRINGLNLYTPLSEDSDNHVPTPHQMPKLLCGYWWCDEGRSFLVLASGDMFICAGKPDPHMKEFFNQVCQEKPDMRAPFMNGDQLYLDEVLARFRNPFCDPLLTISA